MKFKRGDKVKIKKNTTLEEISKNHFNGCQIGTMKFLLNASFDSFEKTFIVKEASIADCVILDNGLLVNTIILDKVVEILDDKEKEYLKAVIRPFKKDVECITKLTDANGMAYIDVFLKNGDRACLPNFKKYTMYKNMEADKGYTAKELGLDE